MSHQTERIGFVSTRFAGTDGVSLESTKWADVLDELGHECFWYAGKLDRPMEHSFHEPQAYFDHPDNTWINDRIWRTTRRPPEATQRITALADHLKRTLYEFIERYDLTMLVLQNAVTIPMHVPLGVAIAHLLQETDMPAIAHHHDFYWERTRFSPNAVGDFLDMAFPPRDPELQHVVINLAAQEELSWRKGLPSILVPNVLDFEHPPPSGDEYATDIRAELGLADDDIMILQPTRVVPRKGIEHAIELVERLGDPRCKLVVSHATGDEGMQYAETLQELARHAGVDLRLIATRIGDQRDINDRGQKIYTLWDLYPHADLVTYPSLYEGFGNGFLEAIYFRCPLVINRYANFARDIEPKGFRLCVMDGLVTQELVNDVRRVLDDSRLRFEWGQHNYALGQRFFSYAVLRRKLASLIANAVGQVES